MSLTPRTSHIVIVRVVVVLVVVTAAAVVVVPVVVVLAVVVGSSDGSRTRRGKNSIRKQNQKPLMAKKNARSLNSGIH